MDRVRDYWVRVALLLSLLLPVYFAIAAIGTKVRLLDWKTGYSQMTVQWGPLVMLGVLAFAVAGLVMALFVAPQRGRLLSILAAVIPAGGLAYAYTWHNDIRNFPPIHDVATDLLQPPSYTEAVTQSRGRLDDGNDLDLLNARVPNDAALGQWSGMRVADVQSRAYSDISSIPTGLTPRATYDIALRLAHEQDWKIGHADRNAGDIEATAESFWFGFIDDVVIRIRRDGSGARVDMRSSSRVGLSDRGSNAKRVRAYLQELRTRLEDAES